MAKSLRPDLIPIQPIKEIDIAFILRLYGFTLTEIRDWTFMGAVLVSLQKILKKDESPKSIVRFPIPNGVAYHLASMSFDHFFAVHGDENLIEHHNVYDTVPLMEDILDAWFSNGQNWRLDRKFGEKAGTIMREFDLEGDLDKVAEMLHGRGRKVLVEIICECGRDPMYASIRHAYALEIADRLIHDRQISAYVAGELTKIAPRQKIGKDEYAETERQQFIQRAKWPAFVKPLILARDRGKCAHCKTDIAMELSANMHIDHMYSLKEGGCNDVVNLQLLCEKCNRKKSTEYWDIKTSVPGYHRRHAQKVLMQRRRKIQTVF